MVATMPPRPTLGCLTHNGDAGEQKLERVLSGSGKRSGAVFFFDEQQGNEAACGNQYDRCPKSFIGADKRNEETGEQAPSVGSPPVRADQNHPIEVAR